MGSMALADLGSVMTAGGEGPLGGKPLGGWTIPFKDLEVLAVIVRHKSIGHIFFIYLESSSICTISAFW